MARRPFFSGNYGSALGSTANAANLIAQAGATQGQMYANLGQQLGGAISSSLDKFRLNKEKKEKEKKAKNKDRHSGTPPMRRKHKTYLHSRRSCRDQMNKEQKTAPG